MSLGNLIHTKQYEKVIAKVRRHPITYVPTMGFFIILLLVPVAVYLLLGAAMPGILTRETSYVILVLFGSLYYLLVMLFFYTSFIEFYLDLHIVTSDRMVDIDQMTLFARKIAEVDLYQIQDVSSEIKGVFGTLFNYGHVDVQTAGSIPKFSMENVPNPHKLRRIILDLAAADKRHHKPK